MYQQQQQQQQQQRQQQQGGAASPARSSSREHIQQALIESLASARELVADNQSGGASNGGGLGGGGCSGGGMVGGAAGFGGEDEGEGDRTRTHGLTDSADILTPSAGRSSGGVGGVWGRELVEGDCAEYDVAREYERPAGGSEIGRAHV